MNVGTPDKPVEICDSEKELERALLDHRLENFKAEINAKLAGFNGYKEQLLRHLRDAYDLGSKAEHFDQAKSWLRIETTAYQYFARQILKQTVTSSADRETRYSAISDVAQRARNMINKARYADHASNLIKAWLDGTKELADATAQFQDRLYFECDFERKFEKVTESLSELEKLAADQAADEVHKRSGRPKGTSDLPWNFIYALADDYRKSTGLRPGAGGGPFARFVHEFLKAVGQDDKSIGYVIDAIKDARRQARKNPSKSTPSPFGE